MRQKANVLIVSVAMAVLSIAQIGLVHVAFAQMDELRNTTPDQRAKLQTAFMKMKLNLTPEQTQSVQAINMKYAQEMQPVIAGSQGKLGKMREAKAINQDKDAELKTVFSPQQYDAYLASKEEMRQHVVDKIKAKRSGAGKAY